MAGGGFEEEQRGAGDEGGQGYVHQMVASVTRPVRELKAFERVTRAPGEPREVVLNLRWRAFETTPFVSGPPLSRRRVAILTSAALIRRGDKPFPFGSGECRFLSADTPAGDLLISHVSINFDRSGWQRDVNVVYPIDRLRELAAAGVIGGVAETHYTVMGSTDPAAMEDAVSQIAGQLRQERIDSVLLTPV